jgi:hypothetical protein
MRIHSQQRWSMRPADAPDQYFIAPCLLSSTLITSTTQSTFAKLNQHFWPKIRRAKILYWKKNVFLGFGEKILFFGKQT